MIPPGLPSPEELGKSRHELTQVLLLMHEQMTPLLDAADGVRADLGARGYSPTIAETLAAQWLATMMTELLGNGRAR